MTISREGGAAHFSASAEAYARTMAPSLMVVAREVVRRAGLRPRERVLDVGTGTGNAAAAAGGSCRVVIGLDAAPGMLDLARRRLPDVSFFEADLGQLPFPDAAFDAVVSCHALLFAEDRVAALREWRRVVHSRGRLSLSVPGPWEATMGPLFREVFARFDLGDTRGYPTPGELAGWAAEAGWHGVTTEADANVAIRLGDETAFRLWLSTGSRGKATTAWTPERTEALAVELLAVTPRAPDGSLAIPFGAIYCAAGA
jgi:SAM-dependent methyltransferase